MTATTPSMSTDLIRVGLANSDGSAVNFSSLTPNKKQIELGPRAEFFDINAAPRFFYVVNPAGTGFDLYAGPAVGGGATNYGGLSDGATVNLPSVNNPLKAALLTITNALGLTASLNSTQVAQQTAGATTALLNAGKTALKDPAGGADISFGGGGGGVTLPNPIRITASRLLATSDNNATLYTQAGDNGTYTLTAPPGLGNFNCAITQLGGAPISCVNTPGQTTFDATGSTAGVGTSMVLSKVDAAAEIYDLKLPTLVPPKAATPSTYPATDDSSYVTPLKVQQIIGLTPTVAYPYVGLSTGALPSSPADGEIILLTDTVWGGSGGSSGSGTEWVWNALGNGWFPKNDIHIDSIISASGVVGANNATAQFIAQLQLPAICNHVSQRIAFDGIFGKSGTSGATMQLDLSLGSNNSSGSHCMASLVLSTSQIKDYFQGEIIIDSSTTFHELSGASLGATTAPLITGAVAAGPLWLNPHCIPTSTDYPIIFALNATLKTFGGK
jgi:hypothetical protein